VQWEKSVAGRKCDLREPARDRCPSREAGKARHVRNGAIAAGAAWLSLTLGGCMVGPDFRPPAPPNVSSILPGGPSGGDRVQGRTVLHGGEVPAQWWELFRSEPLNHLVRAGLAHNQDLRAAEAAVRVAQANALAARGSLFPVAAAGLDAGQQREGGNAATTLYTAQVSISYVPDMWGGVRRQIEAADAQVEVQAFQREAVYLTLVSNIAVAAIEEARLHGQVAATRRIIAIQLDLLRVLRRQHEQGQIGLPEVVTQETTVAQARLSLAPLERDLAKQRNLLAALVGRFPSEGGIGSFQLASFRLPQRLPLSLAASLVRQRPDIRAAEAGLRAANAEIGVAIANRLPQIALTASRGTAAEKASQLFSPGTAIFALGANVAQTVFDAGTLRNRQRAAEEAANQAVAQYRSVVLTSFQDVADVLRALQSDARTLDAAIVAERSASRNVALVRRQVEQGQINIALLVEAQRALLESSLARVDAEASRLSDTVALFQALGGGWWSRPQLTEGGGQPAPPSASAT